MGSFHVHGLEDNILKMTIVPKLKYNQNSVRSRVPVAHTCNPRYSRGRDQEDRDWKPAQANSS
jgi:hypothetical protein